jgi:hypothetical protein
MSAALEQAARDKHILYHAERSKHYELSYPEYVDSYSTRVLEEPGSERWLGEGCLPEEERKLCLVGSLGRLEDDGVSFNSSSQPTQLSTNWHRERCPTIPHPAFGGLAIGSIRDEHPPASRPGSLCSTRFQLVATLADHVTGSSPTARLSTSRPDTTRTSTRSLPTTRTSITKKRPARRGSWLRLPKLPSNHALHLGVFHLSDKYPRVVAHVPSLSVHTASVPPVALTR